MTVAKGCRDNRITPDSNYVISGPESEVERWKIAVIGETTRCLREHNLLSNLEWIGNRLDVFEKVWV